MCQRRFQRIEPGQEGLPSAKECRQKPLRPPFDFEPRGFRTAPGAYSFPYAAAFPFARGSEPYAQGQAFEMGATFAEPRIDGRGEYGLSGDPAPSAVCIFMHSRGNAETGKPRAGVCAAWAMGDDRAARSAALLLSPRRSLPPLLAAPARPAAQCAFSAANWQLLGVGGGFGGSASSARVGAQRCSTRSNNSVRSASSRSFSFFRSSTLFRQMTRSWRLPGPVCTLATIAFRSATACGLVAQMSTYLATSESQGNRARYPSARNNPWSSPTVPLILCKGSALII